MKLMYNYMVCVDWKPGKHKQVGLVQKSSLGLFRNPHLHIQDVQIQLICLQVCVIATTSSIYATSMYMVCIFMLLQWAVGMFKFKLK